MPLLIMFERVIKPLGGEAHIFIYIKGRLNSSFALWYQTAWKSTHAFL